jgi:DNA-binding LacI/PurR family transcriptional regulator
MNNKSNVSTPTRDRVLSAMKQLGVGTPTPPLIGLIVPDSSNPYFSSICFKFEKYFEELGAHVLISSSEGRPDRELELVERFLSLQIKGLLYVPTHRSSAAFLRLVADGTLPVLVFDRKVQAGNFDFVAVNSRHGTLCAVDYLIAHGHRRIAYLKGLESTESARERFESFTDAMAQNRLDLVPEWQFDGDYTLSAGRACAERLLVMSKGERPTAILAANDLMAIGLMQRLQQEGWDIPSQLSVIGFDNIEWSEWVFPSLTTIAQPIPHLVREAARLLMQRVDETGPRLEPRSIQIEPKLIPRASVAEPWSQKRGLRLISPE